MIIWLDDMRPLPSDLQNAIWVTNVDATKRVIQNLEDSNIEIDYLDLDHDLGDYYYMGGDGIKLLDWLEATDRNYNIHLHTMNVVGAQNMRAIIERNRWKEV